jgi:membrane-associated PAP2 superfamily phosphatase
MDGCLASFVVRFGSKRRCKTPIRILCVLFVLAYEFVVTHAHYLTHTYWSLWYAELLSDVYDYLMSYINMSLQL